MVKSLPYWFPLCIDSLNFSSITNRQYCEPKPVRNPHWLVASKLLHGIYLTGYTIIFHKSWNLGQNAHWSVIYLVTLLKKKRLFLLSEVIFQNGWWNFYRMTVLDCICKKITFSSQFFIIFFGIFKKLYLHNTSGYLLPNILSLKMVSLQISR